MHTPVTQEQLDAIDFLVECAIMKREQGCLENYFSDATATGYELNKAFEKLVWCHKNPASIATMRGLKMRCAVLFERLPHAQSTSVEPPPASEYSDGDLVTLCGEIAGRLAMYQTKAMFDRYGECRNELKARLRAASEQPARLKEAEEMLRSACAIADRKGAGTAWDRFLASAAKLGINGITARTYRVLPDDFQNTSEKQPRMNSDPTNGAHALYMANCAKREAELARNPNGGNWYWEGDGEPHTMRFYVRHDCKAGRIDCESKADARNLASLLNKYKLAASIFPE